MTAGKAAELELKFHLDGPALARLAAAGFAPASAPSVKRLRSVYFDTPEGALMQARTGLRVRATPEGFVQTVKAEGQDAFERFEWERPVAGETPERAALPPPDAEAGAVVHAHFDALAPLFVTDFERATWRIREGALEVELALDRGEIHRGGVVASEADAREGTQPLFELEIEQVSGTPLAFWRWSLRFARRHGLRLAIASKNERGLRLSGRLPAQPEAARARLPQAAPTDTVAQAACAAVQSCLAHFTANIEPLLLTEHPSAAHQARVALRRLRAAIRYFGLPGQDPAWARLADRARALANEIGLLRDLDVFEQGTLAELRAALPDHAAGGVLEEGLRRLREPARLRARRQLGAPATTLFVLETMVQVHRLQRAPRGAQARRVAGTDTTAFTARVPLLAANQAQPQSDEEIAFHGSFAAFAQARIEALAKRLDKRARAAETADDWHRARISGKNLRYALDFSAGALPHAKRVARAGKALVALQERLGQSNDRAVALDLSRRVAAAGGRGVTAARAAALTEGFLGHARLQDTADAQALRREVRRLRRLLRRDAPE